MSEGGSIGLESEDGLSEPALVQRELDALKAVAGVTSVTSYVRQRRQPLNKSIVKVRLEGRKEPVTVHCSGKLPSLMQAAQAAAAKVAAILGDEAVAEGRRRAEATRADAEEADAGTRASPGASSAQPQNFFEHAKHVQALEAKLAAARGLVRDADGRVKSAHLLVAAREAAVREAQERLRPAAVAADAAEEALLQAKAAADEIFGELCSLRSKRQRVAEPAVPAAEPEQVSSLAPPHHEMYKDYNLVTFQREESKEMWRRSIVPRRRQSGEEQPSRPRTGSSGALEHWRRGLIGAVQSWANGSLDNVIWLIVKLMDHFNIWEQVYEILVERKQGVLAPAAAALLAA